MHDVVTVTVPPELGSLTPDGFAAVVLAFAESGMAMQAIEPTDVVRLPEVVPDTFVTFRHDRSLVALRGHMFDVAPIGSLRFVPADSRLRRRRGTRCRFEMPVSVQAARSEIVEDGMTIDIGPDGMLIECPLPAAVGDQLTVSFRAPQSDVDVEGVAEVVRAADGLIAVHLPSSSSAARRALADVVISLSRSDLARRDAGAASPAQSADF